MTTPPGAACPPAPSAAEGGQAVIKARSDAGGLPMPKIVFLEPSGARREIEATAGVTLMETARQHGIGGVVALCGGACACASCHVYVAPAWLAKLPPREEMEEGMLESAWEPRPNSRLSCQIHLTAALDGLEVEVPAQQGSL
jgi:ferredoxin, 2Fe-2S